MIPARRLITLEPLRRYRRSSFTPQADFIADELWRRLTKAKHGKTGWVPYVGPGFMAVMPLHEPTPAEHRLVFHFHLARHDGEE